MWSVKGKESNVFHLRSLCLSDVSFRVQPAGRARTIKNKCRTVHAYAVGSITKKNIVGVGIEITYNPYFAPCFYRVDNKERIEKADLLYLTKEGKAFISS